MIEGDYSSWLTVNLLGYRFAANDETFLFVGSEKREDPIGKSQDPR